MKVTFCSRPKTIPFTQLQDGQVFSYNFKTYMKTSTTLDPVDDEVYNSVDLEKGHHMSFKEGDLVEPFESEVMIWR